LLLITHPTGNSNFRAAARSAYNAGILLEFHSCICLNQESKIFRLMPASIQKQLARRVFTPSVPYSLQRSHPWREVIRLSLTYMPFVKNYVSSILPFDDIYRDFDCHVASRIRELEKLKAIYAYEDYALNSFQAARKLGLRCIYDLPIGYWRAAHEIFSLEREINPEWITTLGALRDSQEKLAAKDEELLLADQIIVPSEFVRSTLLSKSVAKAPISVLPFGSPPISTLQVSRPINCPLRLLFVGKLGQRKGLSYVLKATEELGSQVSLTLIGRPTSIKCKPLITALNQYRHIETLPHHNLLEEMKNHDILVFPTLFEGYALVINEALSQGLPVITTVNSGGSETIRNGVEGFIVPIRDSLAIVQRIQQLIDHPDQLQGMRQACLRRAAQLTWDVYEMKMAKILNKVMYGP